MPDLDDATLDALTKAQVGNPYPVRAVTQPINKNSSRWRPYVARHRQNLIWQYRKGGIWPMASGFWIIALASAPWATGLVPNGCMAKL